MSEAMLTPVVKSCPTHVTDKLTLAEYKLIQRIRQTRRRAQIHVMVLDGAPIKLRVRLYAKVEVL